MNFPSLESIRSGAYSFGATLVSAVSTVGAHVNSVAIPVLKNLPAIGAATAKAMQAYSLIVGGVTILLGSALAAGIIYGIVKLVQHFFPSSTKGADPVKN